MAITKIGDKHRKYNVIRVSKENGRDTLVFSISGYEFGVTEESLKKSIESGRAIVIDSVVEYIKGSDFSKDRFKLGKLSIPFDKPIEIKSNNLVRLDNITGLSGCPNDSLTVHQGNKSQTLEGSASTILYTLNELSRTIPVQFNVKSLLWNREAKIFNEIILTLQFAPDCNPIDVMMIDQDIPSFMKEFVGVWLDTVLDISPANQPFNIKSFMQSNHIKYDYKHDVIDSNFLGCRSVRVLLTFRYDKYIKSDAEVSLDVIIGSPIGQIYNSIMNCLVTFIQRSQSQPVESLGMTAGIERCSANDTADKDPFEKIHKWLKDAHKICFIKSIEWLTEDYTVARVVLVDEAGPETVIIDGDKLYEFSYDLD